MTAFTVNGFVNPATGLMQGSYVPIPDDLKYAPNHFAAQVMPFTLLRPAPASAVVGFYSPDHYGYVGRETQIRITMQGGAYPYSAVIDSAPSGATISNDPTDYQNYLVLKFTPTANGTYPIKIRVYDADGANLKTINYTFTVSTNWCVFADPVNGVDSPGNGSFANPFKSIHYARNNTTGGKALMLKNGTYTDTLLGITLNNSTIGSVLAWERRQAVIDLSTNVETTPNVLFYVNTSHAMAQGIVFRNPQNNVASPRLFSCDSATNYVSQDDCWFDLNGRQGTSNIDNVSCFFFGTTNRSYISQTRCEFSGTAGNSNGWSSIDIYGCQHVKIECNTYRDQVSSTTNAGFVWLKGSDNRNVDVTNNRFGTTFAGSLIDLYAATTVGVDNMTGNFDASFNLIRATGNAGIWVVRSDQLAARLPFWTRRNTIIDGIIMIFKRSFAVTFSSDSDVIQSSISTSDPHKVILRNQGTTSYEPLSAMSSLTASVTNYECQTNSGVVDSNGILIGSYAQYRGTRGHEITRV